MYNEVIKLVKTETQRNDYGDAVYVETEHTVFARLTSIGQAEFYQAAATGFRPEIKFILPDFLDYEGEPVVRYMPYGDEVEHSYSVIRTYRSGNELELVCQRGVDQ